LNGCTNRIPATTTTSTSSATALTSDQVQLDTASGGQPPFLIEADQRVQTGDPAHATAIIHARMTSYRP
jgi:hypothetical protein